MNRTRRDPVGAARDQRDAIDRAARGGLDGRAQAWGILADPASQATPYVTVWGRGLDNGGSFDARSSVNGILVQSSGTYEVMVQHRAAAAGALVSLALNGSVADLQAKEGALVSGAASAVGEFTTSTYVGWLYEGDLITAGRAAAGAALQYGAGSGILRIRRYS